MYIYPSAEKGNMEGEEDGLDNSSNSEIRYITLELMKLAQKSGRSFEQVADEFMLNAERLQEMISGETEPSKTARKKVEYSRQQK